MITGGFILSSLMLSLYLSQEEDGNQVKKLTNPATFPKLIDPGMKNIE